jgi:hypothetical protein
MTEDQIERKVESMFNVLDAKLMRGEITQQVYDKSSKDIGAWADHPYWADHQYRTVRSRVPCAR